MKMLVFETFCCSKSCSDGRTAKIKLSFVGDEDTYYIIRQESENKSDMLCLRNVFILNHSISDVYQDTKNTFDKEKEYLKRVGYSEWRINNAI